MPLCGVDGTEGDHDVAVGSGGVGDFFVGDAGAAHLRLGVYREIDEADFFLAVVGDGLVHRWAFAVAKILVRRAVVLLTVVVKRIAAGDLQVGVRVDGDEVLGVHSGSRKNCKCAGARLGLNPGARWWVIECNAPWSCVQIAPIIPNLGMIDVLLPLKLEISRFLAF